MGYIYALFRKRLTYNYISSIPLSLRRIYANLCICIIWCIALFLASCISILTSQLQLQATAFFVYGLSNTHRNTHTHIHTHSYTNAHTPINKHHTQAHKHRHINTHISMHIHAHTHTHAYTHIHTQKELILPELDLTEGQYKTG